MPYKGNSPYRRPKINVKNGLYDKEKAKLKKLKTDVYKKKSKTEIMRLGKIVQNNQPGGLEIISENQDRDDNQR